MNRSGDDDPFIPDLAEPGLDPQPVCWPVIDGETAYATWNGLDTWVRWCARRYTLDQRTVPPCWWRHGALVEELTALRTAWQTAFSPNAPGNAPLEWHAMFAAARQRLHDWAARTGCRPDEHRDTPHVAWTTDIDFAFLTHVGATIERRGNLSSDPW